MVGFLHLTVAVLQQQAHRAMQDPGTAFGDRRSVTTGGHTITCGLNADQTHGSVLDKGVEQAHGIGATANEPSAHRKTAEGLLALLLGLLADHSMKVAHQHRIGVGTGNGSQDVVGRLDVGPQSRMASLVASLRVAVPAVTGCTVAPSSRMRNTLRAWRRVFRAHVDHALQPEASADRGRGDAMLPAPVSAMIRFLPMRRASRACPRALLIL